MNLGLQLTQLETAQLAGRKVDPLSGSELGAVRNE
jgi:hypothetical protein